jgi:hypothetical protein
VAHRSIVLAALTAFVIGSSVSGQQRPDFSGTWMATGEGAGEIPAAPTPVFGERFAVKHAGQKLELVRPVRGRTEPFVTRHNLDGSETRVLLPARTCLGQAGQLVTTAWDGNAIVYTVTGSLAPGSTTPTRSGLKYAFKMTAPDTLVIDTTIRTSATATEPTHVVTVYKKSTDPLPSVGTAAGPAAASATIAQVEWIAGVWTGTMGTSSVEERWLPAAGGSMIATSRTIRGGIMTAFEFLCISERDGGLVYSAMPNAVAPTDFVLTKIDADSATFENPAHDFPKMIRYARKPDGTLEATISGAANSRPTTFVFKKQ